MSAPSVSRSRRFGLSEEPTLLTVHNAINMLSLAIANGFVGAYLLRQGFRLEVVLLLYALIYLVRYALRLSVLPVVRRIGFRRSIMLSIVIMAVQFLPLAWADHPRWLVIWILSRSLGEAIYWPSYHAAVAVAGSVERRGRDLGLRSALIAMANIMGPLIGALMITTLGAFATFATGSLMMLLSAVPVMLCAEFPAGIVPNMRDTLRHADKLGLAVFFIDGWLAAGWLAMWPLVYFIVLGSEYKAFGLANAAAGLVGFLISLMLGHWIDRRRHDVRQLIWICSSLALSILLRATASWWPLGGAIANLTGSAMLSAYVPLIMSAMYDRAKRSDNAFQFHLAIEGAWDTGSICGFLVGAAIAWLATGPVSLICLPALPGVLALVIALWRDRGQVTALAQLQQSMPAPLDEAAGNVPGGV